jgi:hypothetical protein
MAQILQTREPRLNNHRHRSGERPVIINFCRQPEEDS